jgi:hypothetical protein
MPGRIITFYSYKGGTGRTMGLANIAWILATNGRRVLIVDWDLEAPGLHRFFHPFLPDKDLRSSPGVIDMMWEFATAALDPGVAAEEGWHQRLALIQRYAMSVEYGFPGKGTIDLVPAGRQDHLYSALVTSFDWNNFYERLGGGGFLEAIKRDMRGRYDYVLIDSRTGLSDTAGICTVQLPDILVSCFSLSTQAIDGAAAVATSVHRQRQAEQLRIFPVPMRVEDGEHDKLEASRDYARAKFGQLLSHLSDPDRYWGEVEVPYRSFYAYEEILATIGDRPRQENTILAVSERIAGYLTDQRVTELGERVSEAARRQTLARFQRAAPAVRTVRGPLAAAYPRVLICYAYGSPAHFENVRELWARLRDSGADARLDLAPGQRQPDWPSWQADELGRAEVIVVVASPAYRQVPQAELGALRSAYLAYPRRFLDVVLPGGSSADFPEFLRTDGSPHRQLVLETQDPEPLVMAIASMVQGVPVPPVTTQPAVRPQAAWTRRAADDKLSRAMDELRALAARQSAQTPRVSRPLRLRWTRVESLGDHSIDAPDSASTEDLPELLQSLPRGQLVVLGEPGSGKSSTAADLVRRLITAHEAVRDTPVPVLIPVASWDPVERFGDWMTGWLRQNYPSLSKHGADAAERLTKAAFILPVIDGLDELPPRSRPAVTKYLSSAPFVLTSRTAEYTQAAREGQSAPDALVIRLEQVSPADAAEFIRANSAPHDSRWKQVAAYLTANQASPLARCLTTPATISLLLDAYRDDSTDPGELLSLSEPEATSRRLADAFVKHAAGQPALSPRYPATRIRHWLGFLARRLNDEGRRDIAWWKLYTAVSQRKVRALLACVSVFLAAAGGAAGLAAVLGLSHQRLYLALPFIVSVAVAFAGYLLALRPPLFRTFKLYSVPSIFLSTLPSIYRSIRSGPPSSAPRGSFRTDVVASIYLALAFGVDGAVGGIIWAVVSGELRYIPTVIWAAASLTLVLSSIAVVNSAWVRYVIACCWLAADGNLPLRTMRFLAAAHSAGVLTQSGRAYYFRHQMLQDALGERTARRANSENGLALCGAAVHYQQNLRGSLSSR